MMMMVVVVAVLWVSLVLVSEMVRMLFGEGAG
jgi:hypothetical protein